MIVANDLFAIVDESLPTVNSLSMQGFNLVEMGRKELRQFFKDAVQILTQTEGYPLKLIADRIANEVPRMNYARMRNITADSQRPVYVTRPEVEALFQHFPDELEDFLKQHGEPSQDLKWKNSMEERLKEVEEELENTRKIVFKLLAEKEKRK